jgi:hypothetical protein
VSLSVYGALFVFVAIMGTGLPGPGDASLIAAAAAWMLGSVAGFEIGARGGRRLLDHPGRLEKSRRKLLAEAGLSAWRSRRADPRSSPAASDDLASRRGEPPR